MSGDWEKLIKRYAGGRPICNCGQAYYATDGEYMLSGSGKIFHDGKHCKNGCDANKFLAKDEIARCVLAELKEADAV